MIADRGAFGDCCVGSFKDIVLTIDNSGTGLLLISNISASTMDFEAPNVLSYPIKLEVGDSIDVPIRFAPKSFGNRAATIHIDSNDPASPHLVHVSGVAPRPRLSLLIADRGRFPKVCVDHFADQPLVLNNSSECPVSVTGIASSSGAFQVPEVLSFPLLIGPGELSGRADPLRPHRHRPGQRDDSGDQQRSGQSAHRAGERRGADWAAGGQRIALLRRCEGVLPRGTDTHDMQCRECALHVASVKFKRKNPHWRLVNNPFPATLHPGSCLGLVIRYKATERAPIASELIITSDDPTMPVKTLDLMAYTVWDECACKEDCEECGGKGCSKCCGKRFKGICEGLADDCCVDESDE